MSFARYGLWGLVAFALLLVPPPARAEVDEKAQKEKQEKEARPILDEGEHEEYHRRLEEEGEKTLEEINRLLDEIQKNLARKETGQPTQARQKEVVERLNKLIEELGKG